MGSPSIQYKKLGSEYPDEYTAIFKMSLNLKASSLHLK